MIPARPGGAVFRPDALDHVLTAAGLALHTAEPAFLLPRHADDPSVGSGLAYLLELLAGPTR